jgi:hypothetical protein
MAARGTASCFSATPAATADAIFRAVGSNEPPRIWCSVGCSQLIRQIYAGRLASWEKWEAVSNAAQGSRAQ